MMGFVMNILSRLIVKQVWTDKRLWEGFIKCCQMTLPHSISILLQLPAPQLEELFNSPNGEQFKKEIIIHQKKFKKPLPTELQKVIEGSGGNTTP